ncbi:hypothetical protein G4G28_14185 [Massilia sp. Dwa41.01b]|nr:S41 family peptidase [Massilia sp. Dwa41.01b]QNA89334.1 hypothetical protein G4G28_14185 [Massilia sp. Dwa41.01b]
MSRADGSMADVLGWSSRDLLDALRGAPGSTVVLETLPAGTRLDAARKRVSLVRALPGEAGQAPRGRIETVTKGNASYRVGIVEVPGMFEDAASRNAGIKDYASTSREAASLLQGFREAKVDAVLLDLRGNGGGSLMESVKFLRLFLPKGLAALQGSGKGELTSEFVPEGTPAWSGQLGVLVDRGTAAGAELVAGALQGPRRAPGARRGQRGPQLRADADPARPLRAGPGRALDHGVPALPNRREQLRGPWAGTRYRHPRRGRGRCWGSQDPPIPGHAAAGTGCAEGGCGRRHAAIGVGPASRAHGGRWTLPEARRRASAGAGAAQRRRGVARRGRTAQEGDILPAYAARALQLEEAVRVMADTTAPAAGLAGDAGKADNRTGTQAARP